MEHINHLPIDKIVRQDRKGEKFSTHPLILIKKTARPAHTFMNKLRNFNPPCYWTCLHFAAKKVTKSWVFQKVCTSARSLSRTQNRTGKQRISFSRPKEASFSVAEKRVFFDLKENAIFGSFSCLCRREQDDYKQVLDLQKHLSRESKDKLMISKCMEHINHLPIDKIVRQDRKGEKFSTHPLILIKKNRATRSYLCV